MAIGLNPGLLVKLELGIACPGHGMGLLKVGETTFAILDGPEGGSGLRQPVALLQRHKWKFASPVHIAHLRVGGPDRRQRLSAPVDHPPDTGLEADVEFIAKSLAITQIRIVREIPVHQAEWRQQFDGETVGLAFLLLVTSAFPGLAHVSCAAFEPGILRENVMLQQEVSQLMSDGEPRPPLPMPGIGEDRPAASRNIRQEHAFEPVEPVLADLGDIERHRDLFDRDRWGQALQLAKHRLRQKLGPADIAEVDAIELHGSVAQL